MKTLIITFILLLVAYSATAQIQQLVLENEERNEVNILEDNQMLRVVTTSGVRHKGKMAIVDENTISIKGTLIPLNEIDKIKKHSRLVAVLLGIAVVYLSTGLVVGGLLVATFGGEVALGVVLGAAGLAGMYGGINGVNLSRAYKRYQGWNYSIETIPLASILTN